MKTKSLRGLSYDEQKSRCKDFILEFDSFEQMEPGAEYEKYGTRKYMIMLQKIANKRCLVFDISMEDLVNFFRKEDEKDMVKNLHDNTNRYISLFAQLANELIPEKNDEVRPEDKHIADMEKLLYDQRKDNYRHTNTMDMDEKELIPVETHRDYDVVITRTHHKKDTLSSSSISQLKGDSIGSLVTVKAIVLRATEVKPELILATYNCDICGCENYVQVINNSYKPLENCTSKKCRQNRVRGKLTFLAGHSKFRSYQELRIQETPDQMTEGTVPKTMLIKLRGDCVKTASPGDRVIIEGILLPEKKLGFRFEEDLCFYSYIHANHVHRMKKKYMEMNLTEEDVFHINETRANTQEDLLFDKLANSISPNIFGLEDVKKALLLMMVGGVTKQTHDKMRIRGEINVALIGDPGIAKSQLLRVVSRMAPRGVYTTGKGSSGVGLTAAIVTDPLTKELSLEAGALVLADMGVCCIDEFDKMDEYDRTAIHEVMEQQTVSIAKAGITSTLNARTAILAAANPLYGRYNKRETPHKNINMPAALLSRFDLIFIMLDTADKKRDLELARHIAKIHQNQKPDNEEGFFKESFIRNYISMAKQYEPTISEELRKVLILNYTEKRKSEAGNARLGESYTTARSLLGLIRLCQARAKLRFSNEVTESDVDDCLRLIDATKISILEDSESRKPRIDDISVIYNIIRDMVAYSNTKSTTVSEVEERILRRGMTMEQLQTTLKHYQGFNVIMKINGVLTLLQ